MAMRIHRAARRRLARQQEEPQDVAVASVRRRAATTGRRASSLLFRVSIVNNVAICAALVAPLTRPFVAVFFLAVSLAD